MYRNRFPTVAAACFLSVIVSAQPALSQRAPDPLRFIPLPVQDVTGLASGLSYRELLGVAGAGLVVFGVSHFDRRIDNSLNSLDGGGVLRVAEEFGNPRVVLPVSIVIFTGALLSGDTRFQDAAFTSLEALVFADAAAGLLKLAFGRARPTAERGPRSIEPFSGHVSFPSGHATTAFAALSPWFLYYPGPLTAGLLVVAGATAFSRMASDQHWFSDVLAGSAIGFTTAYVLSRRHARIGSARVTPVISANAVRIDVRF